MVAVHQSDIFRIFFDELRLKGVFGQVGGGHIEAVVLLQNGYKHPCSFYPGRKSWLPALRRQIPVAHIVVIIQVITRFVGLFKPKR